MDAETKVVAYVQAGRVVRVVGQRSDGRYVVGFPTVGTEVHWSVASWAVDSLRLALRRASSLARQQFLILWCADCELHFHPEQCYTGDYDLAALTREPAEQTRMWENTLR